MTNFEYLRKELVPFGTDPVLSDSLVDPGMDWELAESALDRSTDSHILEDEVVVIEVPHV